MKKKDIHFSRSLAIFLSAAMLTVGLPSTAFAADPDDPVPGTNYSYTRNAILMDDVGNMLPGVYAAVAQPGDNKDSATIGIPTLAKQNLESMPTNEGPAIIQGAAVPFERRASTGAAIRFDRISDEPIYAPYSMFRYSLIDEGNTNTSGSHTKISGYDGTYVILRIDVSELIKDAPEGSFLHFKQTDNKCMLVMLGEDVEEDNDGNFAATVSDAIGAQAGSFSLDNGADSLKDKDGPCQNRTFITLILMSSGTLVAGADTGAADAPPADFPVSFYVDQQKSYQVEERGMIWDPTLNAPIWEDTQEAVVEKMDASGNPITPATQYLAKYYDETRVTAADVTSYIVKGSDLELEVSIDDTGDSFSDTQYWSLRRAMDYEGFDDHTIKLLCEVPMLEGLNVSGQNRNIALDLNSFDFQIANHGRTDDAGLAVDDGATLTIKDASKTTGAELAVGNNAKMRITGGGTLIIDESCQMEVEYDAASTPAATGTPTPTPEPTELGNGVITIENGGRIVNNGVINVEGQENKALDPAAQVVRDSKDAVLSVGEGGTIENNGAMCVNGVLYNEGTIINNGHYSDIISTDDPDKGRITFHRGIQMSWKDDVTQGNARGGVFENGLGPGKTDSNPDAIFINNGDLVLVPGILSNRAQIENTGNIILSAVDEVIRPITAFQDAPTVMEERVKLTDYVTSQFNNHEGAVVNNNGGLIRTADFALISNGRTGDMSAGNSSDHENISIVNDGTFNNTDKGTIDISHTINSGEMINDAQSFVNSKVVLCKTKDDSPAIFTDNASKKNADVYNGKKSTVNKTDTWEYTEPVSLRITPSSQMVPGGENGKWTIRATAADGIEEADKVQFYIKASSSLAEDEYMEPFALPANTGVELTSPTAPPEKMNVVYTFEAQYTGCNEANATLRVNDDVSSLGIIRPTPMSDLVYNGEEQLLVTLGSTTDGVFQYRVNGGDFSYSRPMAKDAGTYVVDYRIVFGPDSTTVIDPGGTVTVSIAKRPLYIAADDLTSKKGEAISELTYTQYGLTDSDREANTLGISLETDADMNVPGEYPIRIAINEEAPAASNYEYLDSDGTHRISGGVYVVTNDYLSVAQGIKSNLNGFQNLNCGITLAAKYKKNQSDVDDKAAVATVYYSTDLPLDAENYMEDGTTIAPTFAAVGTDATVYYYVAVPNESDRFGGSQRIVITKADQKAPTLNPPLLGADLEIEAVGPKNLGGRIKKLQTIPTADKRAMEYRTAESVTFKRPAGTTLDLPKGTYYIRRAGDNRYYASPEAEAVVPDGDTQIPVTFNANGGTIDGEDTATVNVYYGDAVTQPEDPVRDNSGTQIPFLGWNLKMDNGQTDDREYDFENPVTNAITLIAGWDVTKYTVTFDYGNYRTASRIEEGTKITEPARSDVPGRKYIGWMKEDGTAFDFDTMTVTSDIILTLKMDPYAYSVRFDANGGAGTMEDEPFEYGTAKALSENLFTRDGFAFGGWNTKADGKGVPYEDMEMVTNLASNDGDSVTLYAQWKKNLDADGITVTIGGVSAYSAVYNGKAQRPNVTVKDGTTDITKYCRFEYSNNTNVSQGLSKAKVRVFAQSTRVPYAGETSAEFTITKAAGKQYTLTKEYIYTDTTQESIDLAPYLPKNAGAVWNSPVLTGNIRYDKMPSITGNVLSYKLKPATSESAGTIKVTASSVNYEDVEFTVNITEDSLGLYERVNNVYYIHRNASILQGKKFTLIPRFADGTIANKKVVWMSSDPGVASVTQAGVVTALTPGVTDIKVKSEYNNGTITARCRLTVKEAVSSVTLTEKSHSMGIGERFTIRSSVLPFTASQNITWTVNKSDTVRIVPSADTLSAEIIGLKAGNAVVTATASDGSGKKATVSVAVGNPVPEFEITPSIKDRTLKAGTKMSFKVAWKGKTPKNQGLYWRVTTSTGGDASGIATIDPVKGTLTGISEGALRVTAVSTSNNKMSASTEVYAYVPVKSVALNMTSATVSTAAGANNPQLIAYVTPTVAGHTATGSSFGSKPTVKFEVDPKYKSNLAINVKGVITAKTPVKGRIPVYATVTAYNGYSKKLTCNVTIATDNPLKGITVTPSALTLGELNKETLTATINPANADGDRGYTWSSSDTSIVTVDANGVVTAVRPGVAVITAIANGTAILRGVPSHPVATCRVTVRPSVNTIDFKNRESLENDGLFEDKSFTLKPVFTLTETGRASSTALIYASSDPSIATVSSSGVIKALSTPKRGVPGTVTITATAAETRADGNTPSGKITFRVYSPMEKVTVDKSKLTVGSDGACRYSKVGIVGIMPENVTNIRIRWTANNAGVQLAAVDREDPAPAGIFDSEAETIDLQSLAVKGVTPGVTTLAGWTLDGSSLTYRKVATCTVTVLGKVTGLNLQTSPGKGGYNDVTIVDVTDPADMKYKSTMKAGTGMTITPVVDISGISGSTTDPDEIKQYKAYKKYTDTGVSYYSSDSSVATVSSGGKITIAKGIKGKSVTIFATNADGQYNAQLKITVP